MGKDQPGPTEQEKQPKSAIIQCKDSKDDEASSTRSNHKHEDKWEGPADKPEDDPNNSQNAIMKQDTRSGMHSSACPSRTSRPKHDLPNPSITPMDMCYWPMGHWQTTVLCLIGDHIAVCLDPPMCPNVAQHCTHICKFLCCTVVLIT